MTNRLRFDTSGQVENPTLVVSTIDGRKLGYINAGESFVYQQNFNSADEISLTVHKEFCTDDLWENLTDLLALWYKELDEWFQISVQVDDADTVTKQITGKSICEAELSQTNIFTTEINTEDDILRDDYTEPTVFYNPENKDASLLDRMMDKIPQYKVVHVDSTLMNIQRTFSFDNITILDAFNEVAEEIECLFLYDSSTDDDGNIARTISAYDLERCCNECGYRFEEDGDCPRCGSSDIKEPYGDDSGIIISKDNLSDEAIYKTDIDSVKNCFKMSAGDDLMTATIRSCNANGTDYLWMFPSYLRKYMTDDLVDGLERYEALYNEYENAHNFTISSSAYNNLVSKYISRNDDLVYIYSGTASASSTPYIKLTNFPMVIAAWYYIIDFEGYLKTSMMPTIDISSTNASAQASDVFNQLNGKSVSVTSLQSYSSAGLIETCVKSLAKLYVYTSKYEVTVTTNTWNNPTWTGWVEVTNKNDDTDTASTNLMTMTATAGIDAYTEQLIQVKLNKANTDDYSVVDLFNSYDDSREEFIERLTLYSYDCLVVFSECCQTCIDIIDEQYEAYYYVYPTLEDFRQSWKDRKTLIESEMSVRDGELVTLEDTEDNVTDIIDEVHQILNIENFLGTKLWHELLNYRREDTYINTNYISDGLNNAELIENAELFLDAASKELYKSAMLQHSITSTLKNLLVMPEFETIVDNFQVGSWIRFIVDDIPYKLRLLSYEIQFSNTQNIDVEFSDVRDIWNGTSDIESILKSAVGMGSSYSSVKRQASRGDYAEGLVSGWTQQGLPADLEVVSNANDQEMLFDEHGLLLRRYNDITETYLNDQIKLINSMIAFTSDSWETIHTAIGKIYAPNGEQVFGINTKYLIGQILLGEQVYVESISSSGDTVFKVDADGVYMSTKNTMIESGKSLSNYVESSIEQLADSISMTVTSNQNGTASIVMSANGTNTSFDVVTEARKAFANDNTSISIGAGTITFASGTLVIASNQFSLTAAGNATFSGSLNAATGTFSGSLNAASGTFTGSLQAATGSFSGTITATSGSIGGWSISSNQIYSTKTGTGYICLDSNTGNTNAIYAGSSSANSAPFLVSTDGSVRMSAGLVWGYLNVYGSGGSPKYGQIGYMAGQSDYGSTDGIAMAYTSGNSTSYYVIATSAGVRMQAMNTEFSVVSGGGTLTGNLNVTGSVSEGSDECLKEDMTPLADAYSVVFDNLNPISYRYISNTEKLHMGFTTQNVQAALTDAGFNSDDYGIVSEAKSSDGSSCGTLAYNEIIALLVREVQNLKAEVKTLTEEIKNLKKEKE